MSKYDYELVVIGGGPAGEKGAAQAAYFGHHTALIEKAADLGGACINTGTLASKTLRESALFLSGFKTRQLYGIDATVKKDITLSDFMHRKNHVQEKERARAKSNLERHKIDRIHGQATLLDAHTVLIKEDSRRLTAKFILIATGSIPARPPGIPFNNSNVFDSDTVLEMRDIPKSMLVIGGGVIGSEYANLFAAIGLKVTVVHRGPRLLEFLDNEIGEAFTTAAHNMGIDLVLNDQLDSVALEDKRVHTRLKSGKEIITDSLLYAAGRSGNTAALGLEQLGIPLGKYGHIEAIDSVTYRTKIENIYAAGDCLGPPALALTSMEQARVAMCNAFNIDYKKSVASILPYGIYSIPEISGVGETEESCQKKKIPYVVGRNKFGQHARGQIIGDTEGLIKLLFSPPDGKLIGAHVMGEMASELVHVPMTAMHFSGTVDFFVNSVFNYPTLGDVFKYAGYDALAKLNESRKAVS